VQKKGAGFGIVARIQDRTPDDSGIIFVPPPGTNIRDPLPREPRGWGSTEPPMGHIQPIFADWNLLGTVTDSKETS